MAGVGGVEPPHTAPETAVLPLDDTPSISRCCDPSLPFQIASANGYITHVAPFRQGKTCGDSLGEYPVLGSDGMEVVFSR